MDIDKMTNFINVQETRQQIKPINEIQQTESNVVNYKEGVPKSSKEIGKEKQEQPVNDGTVRQAISDANNKIRTKNTMCEFGYNEKLNRVTIKVLDKQTEEVIREIPAEKTLEMLEKVLELAGILVDEKL